MMCRMMITSRSASQRLAARWLITSGIAAVLVLPSVASGQNRFPTFGLPSSAYGNPAVKSSAGQQKSAPRSLSPSQTNGARLVAGHQTASAVRPVAHSEAANTSSTQQPSAVQRELQRLYDKNGGEMPPMNMPSGGFQKPPVQQTSTGSTVKRSVVDLMKRQDTRFDTVQPQSSVRPEPTAQPQQNPPRDAAAVRPTDGRRTAGGVLSGLFNWGGRSTRSAAPTVPPREPSPYRPPTYRAQPPARQPAPKPPQPTPATAKAATRRPAPVAPQTAQRPAAAAAQQLRAPAPQPPATTTESATVKSFDLIPLTEPVLAPPAEDDFFPADVAESTPQRTATQEIQVTPQPKSIPPQVLSPQAVAETIPEVIPQPKNYARELGIAPKVQQPAAEIAAQVTMPQPTTNAPSDDDFGMGDLFPDDETDTAAGEELESFQLPKTVSNTPPPADVAVDPTPSPFTGRKLETGAFEQPMETPNVLVESTPEEPAHFFPTDEHAIEPEERLDINPDNQTAQRLVPNGTDRVATADSHPGAGTHLTGSRMQQIAARDGVGLKGYCPVALRDERTLKDGKAAYITFYHSKAYYFSSAESKATFDDQPDRYAPASHGNDVTLMALTGEVLEGSLDHAVWYKDRLYLFSTDENLKTFMAAPSAMAVTQ